MDMDEGAAGPPILTIEGQRATIRLNRPRVHNRLEPADLEALMQHCDMLDANPGIRVVVLTGTGRSFSSGYHLGDLSERPDAEVASQGGGASFEGMVSRFEALRAPTICRLNGGVYGGATDLALCCDFRIGVTAAEMFMPAAQLGLHYYPSGMVRYVSRLGLNAAKRLFLSAERMPAAEMLAIGFLTDLVLAEDLDARVNGLATRLEGLAPLAVQGVKLSLNEIARGGFDVAAALARAETSQRSEDLREGLAAFHGKRAPLFKGR